MSPVILEEKGRVALKLRGAGKMKIQKHETFKEDWEGFKRGLLKKEGTQRFREKKKRGQKKERKKQTATSWQGKTRSHDCAKLHEKTEGPDEEVSYKIQRGGTASSP